MNKIFQTGVILLFLFAAGCFKQQPTGANLPASLSLQLRVANWSLLQPEPEAALARTAAPAQITRVEIFITLAKDTLAARTVPLAPGAGEFSASFEIPSGEDYRVIVEAWDDNGVEGGGGLLFRGVQANVVIIPEVAQTVSIVLYPVPIAGQRVVLIVGGASGTPGSSGNLAPISLISADSLSGVQFDLNFNPAVIAPVRTVRDAALPWSSVESNVVNNGSALRLLLFDNTGRRLPVFNDPAALARVDFRVSNNAAIGVSSSLTISNPLVLDANRRPLEVAVVVDTFVVVDR